MFFTFFGREGNCCNHFSEHCRWFSSSRSRWWMATMRWERRGAAKRHANGRSQGKRTDVGDNWWEMAMTAHTAPRRPTRAFCQADFNTTQPPQQQQQQLGCSFRCSVMTWLLLSVGSSWQLLTLYVNVAHKLTVTVEAHRLYRRACYWPKVIWTMQCCKCW